MPIFNEFSYIIKNYYLYFQNVGKGKISKIPKDIAQFLKISDFNNYTGHAYRRTSATLLVDQGADETMLMRHGNWKSSAVARSYCDHSDANNKKISGLISKAMKIKQHTTASTSNARLSQEEVNEIQNISQKEYGEVISTNFGPPNKKAKIQIMKKAVDEVESLSQEELLEVTTTDFFDENVELPKVTMRDTKKKVDAAKPIYNFYNCKITIQN